MALENRVNGCTTQPHTEFTQQIVKLKYPSYFEVKNVLEPALRECFNEANVSVVPCPDLRESPFHLAAPGLSGFPVIMEVGGPEFLWDYPTSEMDASWKLPDLLNQLRPRRSSFVIGASRSHGTFNYEVATNFTYRMTHGVMNKSYFSFVNNNKQCESELVTNPNRVICDLYGNFFISDGKPEYALKVHAKGRRISDNFPTVIQKALRRSYEPNDFIGLGGTFVINNGIVRNKIRRPNFDEYAPWEQINEASMPLIAVGTILSRMKHTSYYWEDEQNVEPNSLECFIETEHFQTFPCNGIGVGGQFINDITPNDTEYDGYFNLALRFIRVCPP